MKEVSCRFFEAPLRDLRARGVDANALVAGTAYMPASLADKDERIEWDAVLQMMDNARQLWTRDQLLALGARSTEGPLVRFIGVIARLRFSVQGFYQWVTAPDGVANQMVTCMKTSSQADGPGRLIVEFKMEPGYRVNEEFFLITQGTYAAMPRMLGAPRSEVTSEVSSTGAVFRIDYAESRGVLARLRRTVTWPFTARQAAVELSSAHTSLLTRYRQLDAMRGALQRQHEIVDTAYQIGQKAWGERDLQALAKVVTASLLARSNVSGARLEVGDQSVGCGAIDGPCAITVPLPGSPGRGQLEVWLASPDDETQRLVELLAPTIALAVDNAIAYRELAEYQANLERLVDERTLELREAQAARERFFGSVSHEIRTPLSLIMLAAGDIEKRAGKTLDPRANQNLGSINDSARKLVRLVDELLLLAAGQEGKFKIAREPTDLAALVQQIAVAWRPATEAAGLELAVRVPDALTTHVDPVALERVISNLLSNAVKYTPRGGHVELELVDEPSGVRLSILDTGPGIDSELAGRLFGRFERGVRERLTKGTGIGLSLVKQLVEAHEGTIDALPRTGTTGTEMRVLLPRSEVRDVVAPIRGLQLEVVRTHNKIASGTRFEPAGLPAGTIVIAEDDAGLAEATARTLSERYTVIVGLDGEAALELVKQHHPQLLITDIDMPRMNGLELAKHYRAHTGDRLSPIIMLSAVIDLGTRVAGLEAGAIDYVTKPFDPRELLARVDAQFRMRELAVKLHQAEQLSTLGILTSGLAHELRNPANGIVNAIRPLKSLLRAEAADPGSGVSQLLDVIKGCSDQIAFMSRQLLGFKRGGQLEMQPADLRQLVDQATSLARTALADVEVRIHAGIERPVPCSGPLLVQALTNLIENAGHAAGPKGWIEVTTRTEAGRALVEVADSGAGVPVELRERIFEPYFTTKDPGVGTGLGLPISRAIVQRHGGALSARERNGRTVFVLEVPCG